MGSKRLLLLGAGGHCKSVLDSLLASEDYDEIGLVCKENVDITLLGARRVGTDAQLSTLFNEGWLDVFIAVGSVGNTDARRKLYKTVREIGFNLPCIIDGTAVVANNVEIMEGTYIGKNAVVNTGSTLGICTIINAGAIVEHDCTIGAFTHISPGAVLCGQVTVGDDTHIGANCTIRQQIIIGHSAIVGIGSVVTKSIPDHVEAYGNPCRVVKTI